MSEPDADTYALKASALAKVAAPDLPYQPPAPRNYRPRIGVIGAGGIVSAHLDAYRIAGWEVAALCNRTLAKAEAKAAEYAPKARITDRWEDVLNDPAIDVVDITPHPADRLPIIEAALKAGKHVLSQKPFVLAFRKVAVSSPLPARTASSLPSTRMAGGRRIWPTCARLSGLA